MLILYYTMQYDHLDSIQFLFSNLIMFDYYLPITFAKCFSIFQINFHTILSKTMPINNLHLKQQHQ